METLLFFLQGIPEIAGIVACSLALARVKLRWGIIFVFAGILTVVIYIIRNLPVTFGLHTVAGILLCALFMVLFTKVSPSKAFTVVFASGAVLALLELVVNTLFTFLRSETGRFISNGDMWMSAGFTQAFIMIVIALAIARFGKPMEGMWKEGGKHYHG